MQEFQVLQQPDLASQAVAVKSSARSRLRRKRVRVIRVDRFLVNVTLCDVVCVYCFAQYWLSLFIVLQMLEARQSALAEDKVVLWNSWCLMRKMALLTGCLDGLCDLRPFAARSSPSSVPGCSRDYMRFRSTAQCTTEVCEMDRIRTECRQ